GSELVDRSKFTVKGPQVDMGLGFWGCLYGELFGGMMQKARPQSGLKINRDGFNDFHITCAGRRVIIKLNGVMTVDNEFPTMPDEGIIALQLHAGDPMEVVFRNLFIKDLSAPVYERIVLPGHAPLETWGLAFS